MRNKCIMFQGTNSTAGKSLLTAALCRALYNQGFSVAPFKSQNMALNSYITADGFEMGRAQVVQAEAAHVAPMVEMNPVLLKPTGDSKSQIVLCGKPLANMNAADYHKYKQTLKDKVLESYQKLEDQFDYVILEGAGSPAEINLKDNDIVNMGMAKMCDAPVILIGDGAQGGAFASLAGTIALLDEDEKKRVKGLIINKCAEKCSKAQLEKLESITGIKVIGVVPFLENLDIEDEDSVTDRFENQKKEGEINIAVIRLPRMSNFTDFNALGLEEGVALSYEDRAEGLTNCDLIIIPGSKNTIEDLEFLKKTGLYHAIEKHTQNGGALIGICGGYQMLAKKLHDPMQIESDKLSAEGFGMIDMEVTFEAEKMTAQAQGEIRCNMGILEGIEGSLLGYEIHMGTNSFGKDAIVATHITMRKEPCDCPDGAIGCNGNAFGTYMHGIFDNAHFTRGIINNLRKRKGLAPLSGEGMSFYAYKQAQYDKLAEHFIKHVDMEYIHKILGGLV